MSVNTLLRDTFGLAEIVNLNLASDSRASPQTCNSQFLAPQSAIHKKGDPVQFGNPETIRANLRIDSHKSGHPS